MVVSRGINFSKLFGDCCPTGFRDVDVNQTGTMIDGQVTPINFRSEKSYFEFMDCRNHTHLPPRLDDSSLFVYMIRHYTRALTVEVNHSNEKRKKSIREHPGGAKAMLRHVLNER